MHTRNVSAMPRRSSRVPATLPILVTGAEPDAHFSELCETLVVSPYGCSMRSPVKLGPGSHVHFQSKEGRRTLAHIVDCQPMELGQQGWRLGAKLDRPENFWNLETYPADWTQLPDAPRLVEHVARKTSVPKGGPSPDHAAVGQIQEQISDEHLRSIVSELVRPLHAEVASLQQQLAQSDAKRSRFDISLTHIPEEVEEKLWVRLREDLGTQVLHQTREQSEQLLGAAKVAIEKKMVETEVEFRQHVTRELKTVEQRAQGFAEQIDETVEKHLHSGVEQLQKRAAEAETHLTQESDQLLRYLLQRLGEEHNVHRREVQKLQNALASEMTRLQSQVSELDGRVAGVDESARQLEADLDTRLTQVADEIAASTQNRLKSATETALAEFGNRGARVSAEQLAEACERLKTTQQGIEANVVTLLRAQVTETLLSFGQTMEALAQDSVERWRLALARDLGSVAKILGEQVRSEELPKSNGTQRAAIAG